MTVARTASRPAAASRSTSLPFRFAQETAPERYVIDSSFFGRVGDVRAALR